MITNINNWLTYCGKRGFWYGQNNRIIATEDEVSVINNITTTIDFFTYGTYNDLKFTYPINDSYGVIIYMTQDPTNMYQSYGLIREGTDVYFLEENAIVGTIQTTGTLDEWRILNSSGTVKVYKNNVLVFTFLTIPVGNYQLGCRLIDPATIGTYLSFITIV